MKAKRISSLIFLSLFSYASADRMVSDGFDNDDGAGSAPIGAYAGELSALDGVSTAAGIGWTSSWSSDSDSRWFARSFDSGDYSAGGQTVTRVNPAGSKGSLRAQGGSGFESLNRSFTNTSGAVYFSFTAQGAVGNDNFRLAITDSTDLGFWLADNGANLGVSSTNSGFVDLGRTFTGAGAENTDFIVVGIDDVGAATANVSVWFNPNDLTDIGSIAATATFSISGGGALSKFTLSSGGSNNIVIDEFRLGTTIQDVTGISQIPETSHAGLILGGAALSSLVLRRR